MYGDDERSNTEKLNLVTPPAAPAACHTKPRPISFAFSLLVLKAAPHLPFSLLSMLVLFKPKKCLGAAVIITAFFNEAMDIMKTVKTLNLAEKLILPKKGQS